MALAMSGPRGSFAPGSHLLRKLTEAGRQLAEAYHSAHSSHPAHSPHPGNGRPSFRADHPVVVGYPPHTWLITAEGPT
jgi:hypothetical protein